MHPKAQRLLGILAILTVIFLLAIAGSALAKPNTLNRDEIPDNYKWDLSDIYADWNAWEEDYARLEKMIDEYALLKGTLSGGPDNLLTALKSGDEIGMLMTKVDAYAGLASVTDTRDNEIAARYQKVMILDSELGVATSWFNPELLAIPWDTMKSWLDGNEELSIYRYNIENLYRRQAHVLSQDKEQLLSYFGQSNSSPSSIYQEIIVSDIKFPDMTLTDGDKVTLTEPQTFFILRTNRNQNDRSKAFEEHYKVYQSQINTYAAIYNAVLQRDWAMARARNYGSCLEASLDRDNAPVEVYTNLIAAVKEGSGPMQRYMRLRKEALGVESYHLYDGFVSLVDFEKAYEYDIVKDWIKESVSPLGDDYKGRMDNLFGGGWVDVYENEGKYTGAFSAGVYGVHPYLLLNFDESLEEVFTIAHEAGHALHSMHSDEYQPYATSDYTTFVAEVASTMNEALFLDYMLENSRDPLERIALLQQALDNIAGSFYKQTFFADFELRAHQMVEQGQPVTADALRELYGGMLKEYYGKAQVIDEIYHSYWARISHFYDSPFYVFKYATSYSASAEILERIKSKDKKVSEDALSRYLTLLKSGGNNYPIEQLKKAGVDLTKKETFQAVVNKFDNLVTQLETELKNAGII